MHEAVLMLQFSIAHLLAVSACSGVSYAIRLACSCLREISLSTGTLNPLSADSLYLTLQRHPAAERYSNSSLLVSVACGYEIDTYTYDFCLRKLTS